MQTHHTLHTSYHEELPIHARRAEIIRAIKQHQIIVIAGETGSGKTTQLPKFLIDAGYGQCGLIGCTQPRRIAALSVARRIAEELGVTYGHEVGAKIRFTDQTRSDTRIKLMTDGILLNEIQDDPMLCAYQALIIDEAHERSLNIDFILGCLRQLCAQRKDLKLIISSATIDTASFSNAFNRAPIIEVSGRMYPVEMHYRPIDDMPTGEQERTFIEAAIELVHEIVTEQAEGDILVFLPGERDIHEMRRQLDGSLSRSCVLLPLYGRLGTVDQQRIFQPQGRRRIILSTNIAETSLTVPGIRYVIDSGLARISRYSAHSRTQRLPIEAIAQSSANQRAGRCGRVSNGVCYRLYSEADFDARPRFTPPEIKRSNLASVILRMLAYRLGDVRTFPFIDPPAEHAIRGGYRLLEELEAVYREPQHSAEERYRLTQQGRHLAQLPIDPTVARMLLQARQENVVDDVLVIAAGLSIQDPRERPVECAAEADAMHRRFIHKESDFLTLLNIWRAYHHEMERLSQSKLRIFCRQHFLSYQRMREWRDIHHQLERILQSLTIVSTGKNSMREQPSAVAEMPDHDSRGKGKHPLTEAGYAAIHRSILSGLLSNIACKQEGHQYRGPYNRKALLFPGSGLFDHNAAKQQRKATYAKTGKSPVAQTAAPAWIVCGEWMETSRLFARTAARIEVEWIEQMAGDLLKLKYSEPFWSTQSAAALCKQRKILFGLEISRTNVSLSRVDADESTDIFVRNGLVELGIRERPEFLTHNVAICEQATSELARRRLGSSLLVHDRLFDFYRQRLHAVGSYAELRRFAKRTQGGRLEFLKASLDDLLPQTAADDCMDLFPDSLTMGGRTLSVRYRHAPGDDADGVTVSVPLAQFDAIQQSTLDWAIPGHLEATIESLLRSLPKPIRIRLHPLKQRAAELRARVQPSKRSLCEQLKDTLCAEFGIHSAKKDWAQSTIPRHLRPRIQVTGAQGEILCSGRDLAALRASLDAKAVQLRAGAGLHSLPAWRQATARIEREHLRGWNFDDLPEAIDLTGQAGLPLTAFPALVLDGEQVHLRLMSDQSSALEATQIAWPVLGEIVMGREIAWLRRELNALQALGTLLLPLGGFASIQAAAWAHIRRHLFACASPLPLQQSTFNQALARADRERPGIICKLRDRLHALLQARQEVSRLLQQKQTAKAIVYPGMRAQMECIAPATVLEQCSFDELPHITRFLTAMQRRAERAKVNVQRDIERSKRVAPYEQRLNALKRSAQGYIQINAVKRYQILLEEFKVSVYAQELGTAQKVSEKRLDALAESIESQFNWN